MTEPRPIDVTRKDGALAPRQPEIWRVIEDYPAYSVSSHGRVRRDAIVRGGGGSIRTPSGVLKQRPLPLGHRQVTLSINNKPTTVLVSRLVAKAFLPPPEPGKDCACHRDDDPSNNYYENLFWGTRQDNIEDMKQKGRQATGQRVFGAKLDDIKIRAIRSRAAQGATQRAIATEFGIAQSNVSLILSGKSWRHVA